ncbi:response regulator transcription factor [Synechococcus sp. PCC 7336]|uniref:response regulator transcription factor n=1 Tax=Synechococcus sp. PCC 7336 TaxID=195250 RepID=UPI00034DE01E|nr:response regulator transcription factor [Synechococcus sp. PCC 7336]
MKLLVVEDDRRITALLQESLAEQNFLVEVAHDGEMGWDMLDAFKYDLVLLDVMLPKLDGISLCRKLRSRGYQLPILMLTAKDTTTDKVVGLDAGADDYVVKPFKFSELSARIRALLRRGIAAQPPVLERGLLRLDPSTCQVTYDLEPLNLTPKEYSLLELLMRNGDRIFSRSAILDRLWSFEEPPDEEAVKFHIKRLRHKLRQAGATTDPIETVYGMGYRLK